MVLRGSPQDLVRWMANHEAAFESAASASSAIPAWKAFLLYKQPPRLEHVYAITGF